MSVITKEMIFAAANAIDHEGKIPKVADVRARLGKGSFTTINEAMKEWREAQKAPEAPLRESAPEEVALLLEALGSDIWSKALSLANERLRTEREALEAVRIEMEEQQKETAEMADALASEIENLREENTGLKSLIEIERSAHEATRNLHQATTDDNIRLTAKLETADKHFMDLKAESKHTYALLDKANNERDKLIDKDRQQASKISLLELSSKNTKSELEESQQNEKAAQAIAQAAQIENATLNGQIETLQKQIEQQSKLFETLANNLKPAPSKPNNKSKSPNTDSNPSDSQ